MFNTTNCSKLNGNDSCPSKLQSQHSSENLAGRESKFEEKSLLYANESNVNKN